MSPKEFIEKSKAEDTLKELKNYFKDKDFIVSDVLSKDGKLQYADLVQEGGTLWGFALIGYIYILEEMGIRFYSMAGTSAGAINTMLLAVAGKADDKKHPQILEHILNVRLTDFLDGSPIQSILAKLVSRKGFINNFVYITRWIIMLFLAFAISAFLINMIIPHVALRPLNLVSLILLVIIISIFLSILIKLKDFIGKGYGPIRGAKFHEWLKDSIEKHHIHNDPKNNNIKNLADFNDHFSHHLDLKMRQNDLNKVPPNGSDRMITIITCEISSKRKITFPKMWDMFWDKPEHVHPADLVRASMSIPFFFKFYELTLPQDKISAWKNHIQWNNKYLPNTVRFVDGGAISNFPLNVFQNPNYPEPRMPTFGVRLSSNDGNDEISKLNSILDYIKTLVSMIRGYYDKDFELNNPAFILGVKYINLEGHNSLNFFMSEDEKMKIFKKGADSAAVFLKDFDWVVYKRERINDIENKKKISFNPNGLNDQAKIKSLIENISSDSEKQEIHKLFKNEYKD
ncbi:MAG: hypothetical protein JPMHGGIA_02358 [Saprospiraceae bacterium]|jgi:NTE family protein|nr:patatin-like phospholipase family protein [Saprospiraceae bacterium]MBV6474056.1 hypothetical protein [Saprospiraceae bacterium]